jgi:protein-S-isoprenylcysteine O-methyltransferase Ste14
MIMFVSFGMAKPRSKAFVARGVAGIIILLPALVLSLLGKPLLPLSGWGAIACDVVAWAILAAGGVLRLRSILYVGGRKGTSLVTDGPYAMCRNPLYLGSLLSALAGAIFLKSGVMIVAILLVSGFYIAFVIRSEELQLEAAFGDEWRKYVASVPRILPRIPPKAESEKKREVDLRALKNEILRVAGILVAIPLAAHVLNFARQQPGWPHLWPIP